MVPGSFHDLEPWFHHLITSENEDSTMSLHLITPLQVKKRTAT